MFNVESVVFTCFACFDRSSEPYHDDEIQKLVLLFCIKYHPIQKRNSLETNIEVLTLQHFAQYKSFTTVAHDCYHVVNSTESHSKQFTYHMFELHERTHVPGCQCYQRNIQDNFRPSGLNCVGKKRETFNHKKFISEECYFRCDKTGHFARECPDGEPEEREVMGELDREKGSVHFKAIISKGQKGRGLKTYDACKACQKLVVRP